MRERKMIMKKFSNLLLMLCSLAILFISSAMSWSAEPDIINVQKYERAIHIMAMLLVGFGFLMVFVKKYGRSAITATYLLVSVAIPLYMLIDSFGIFGELSIVEIDRLILAEFAAASLLICAGAPLGRLTMGQYIFLGVFFVPCYALNEWILLENGLGLITAGSFIDVGGSILIHAFGAIFGICVAVTMTTKKEMETPIEVDDTSDRFSLLGSMILWVFWPSFCSALVAPENVPHTAINVILALSGSTLATYFSSRALRKGKISAADIANAALAGGVAIGSTCSAASFPAAFIIGILAGALSTLGFAVLQPIMERILKVTDTCGVSNLHGRPGILGGVAAIFVVDGINKGSQFAGIGITIVIAICSGLIVGKLLSLSGRRTEVYNDEEEFSL